MVHGYVHDETASFSGGVQGNAGLFGTAGDIAKICQMLLNGGTYGDVRVLSANTADLFTTAKSPTCRRGLGFDKPDMANPAVLSDGSAAVATRAVAAARVRNRRRSFIVFCAYRTGYRPLERIPRSEIAPTENDTFLRRQVVQEA